MTPSHTQQNHTFPDSSAHHLMGPFSFKPPHLLSDKKEERRTEETAKGKKGQGIKNEPTGLERYLLPAPGRGFGLQDDSFERQAWERGVGGTGLGLQTKATFHDGKWGGSTGLQIWLILRPGHRSVLMSPVEKTISPASQTHTSPSTDLEAPGCFLRSLVTSPPASITQRTQFTLFYSEKKKRL